MGSVPVLRLSSDVRLGTRHGLMKQFRGSLGEEANKHSCENFGGLRTTIYRESSIIFSCSLKISVCDAEGF